MQAEWLERNVQSGFAGFDARDLLCLVRTWRDADISRNDVFCGDLERALRAVEAPVVLMPINDDLIFPRADFEAAQRLLRHAIVRPLASRWGHRAGAPGTDAADIRVLEDALTWFLAPPRSAFDCFAAVSTLFVPT